MLEGHVFVLQENLAQNYHPTIFYEVMLNEQLELFVYVIVSSNEQNQCNDEKRTNNLHFLTQLLICKPIL